MQGAVCRLGRRLIRSRPLHITEGLCSSSHPVQTPAHAVHRAFTWRRLCRPLAAAISLSRAFTAGVGRSLLRCPPVGPRRLGGVCGGGGGGGGGTRAVSQGDVSRVLAAERAV